jgi:hypothetical protein
MYSPEQRGNMTILRPCRQYGKYAYFDAGLILTPITTKKVTKVIVYIDFGIKHSSKCFHAHYCTVFFLISSSST